jgi:hypothetical protein
MNYFYSSARLQLHLDVLHATGASSDCGGETTDEHKPQVEGGGRHVQVTLDVFSLKYLQHTLTFISLSKPIFLYFPAAAVFNICKCKIRLLKMADYKERPYVCCKKMDSKNNS